MHQAAGWLTQILSTMRCPKNQLRRKLSAGPICLQMLLLAQVGACKHICVHISGLP